MDNIDCPNCGSQQSGVFCVECGSILPYSEINYFTMLEEPTRPMLDANKLKETYRTLSPKLHPDHFQTKPAREKALALQWASLLNKAYQTLRDPKLRIRYLISLKTGADPDEEAEKTAAISNETMQLFNEVREECSKTDAFLEKVDKVASRIVLASLLSAESFQTRIRQLSELREKIAKTRLTLLECLKQQDEEWMKDVQGSNAKLLEALKSVGDGLSFLDKFDALIEERLLSLDVKRQQA
ncbi:MAG: Fe-S protein assembly co-chaperone HscB [Candidatus Bathyarchaeia archaeon]